MCDFLSLKTKNVTIALALVSIQTKHHFFVPLVRATLHENFLICVLTRAIQKSQKSYSSFKGIFFGRPVQVDTLIHSNFTLYCHYESALNEVKTLRYLECHKISDDVLETPIYLFHLRCLWFVKGYLHMDCSRMCLHNLSFLMVGQRTLCCWKLFQRLHYQNLEQNKISL